MADRPDFIIIGAMKCATTTLHDQLAVQPGLFMTVPKEPNFFSDDANYRRGPAWYSALFAAAPAGAVCGESSTHYTKLPTHPRTIERLRAFCPDVKLIYLMKHPIDRLVSHYQHAWSLREVHHPLEEAASDRPEWIEYGRYHRQLAPYLDAFGPARLLPIFVPYLLAHPQATLERVGAFIGAGPLTWQAQQTASNVSAERLRLSDGLHRLLFHPLVASVRRRLVPLPLRQRVKARYAMPARPALSAAYVDRLKAVFDPDLAQLGAWFGHTLDCDNFDRVTRSIPPGWR